MEKLTIEFNETDFILIIDALQEKRKGICSILDDERKILVDKLVEDLRLYREK